MQRVASLSANNTGCFSARLEVLTLGYIVEAQLPLARSPVTVSAVAGLCI